MSAGLVTRFFRRVIFLRLAVLALLFSFSTGFTELFQGGNIRPVAIQPLRDQPARLTMLHNGTPVKGGTLVALIVNFDGQNLTVSSSMLSAQGPVAGNIGAFLDGRLEPYQYRFFEVRNRSGKVLGYLLMHREQVDNHFLYGDKNVFIEPVEVETP
jgi:hypothetical protein